MSKLLVKPSGTTGLVVDVTPESAGWTYVGFALHKLKPGDTVTGGEPDREACLVLVSGKAAIGAGDTQFGSVGRRMSPFDGKPSSVYVPAGMDWTATAETEVELAVCTAPGTAGARPPRLIAEDDNGQEVRGKGSNVRHVTNILPETAEADGLLVVEVITPAGNTSSYPPHRHDEDDLPQQSSLEETYYHRINPPQGFAFQRVYTDADASGRREIDEAMAVEDGDTTLVPKGYHPCATIHGYDLYYLNVMAGPKRLWRFHNAPEHEWLLKA
ncbi:5-deoxy-glucuronate isomerase [Aureimonas sp. Leaf324]|jgi:5-deoxy-glucuronate isomerase|uniref:5-deoxy-glucuronate isomerase n=1 Tax=Aureimonas sp. Leaf324 TaxID=1736336 RepID=UPI000701EF2A|nr:5-deoxy-glucuronate isomerase [Aureimonas sp. Leaf324]KQQ91224.1 5-deoxy-glucuronate isomerase [Aureimonas sp. Leaf324]